MTISSLFFSVTIFVLLKKPRMSGLRTRVASVPEC